MILGKIQPAFYKFSLKDYNEISMTVLQKLRNLKLPLAPEQKNVVSDEEMKEGFNLLLDKLVKEKGENWFETASSEEIENVIMANARQIGKEYFEKKLREKIVNIIADGVTGMKKG